MPTIEDVKHYLFERSIEVWEFEEPTPNCELAARAVGCSVGEIAKSLLFFVGRDPVVVITCGDLKVKNAKLKEATGLTGKVRLPSSDEVIQWTGYAPGGVCPFLLPADLRVLVDVSMRRFPKVYAAAGNAHSAVPVTFDQLLVLTGGEPADVCGMNGSPSPDCN
jgi:prolyl-tRNA editing enzyme YbaK/EbsC (Cys-tRNA(Pro) deacylase)